MNVILFEASELDAEGRVLLDDGRSRHIRTVLKSKVGDTLRAGILDGPLGTATVESLDPLRLAFVPRSTPPPPRIDLLLAMPRPKALGRLYSPIAQLGVRRLVLTGASKVERYYFDAHQTDDVYIRAHLIEGLSQAGDTHLPQVSIFPSLEWSLRRSSTDYSARWVADPAGARSCLDSPGDLSGSLLVAIGPEGGWTESELARFREFGFESIHLGRRILRTDVAVVGVLTMLRARLGI